MKVYDDAISFNFDGKHYTPFCSLYTSLPFTHMHTTLTHTYTNIAHYTLNLRIASILFKCRESLVVKTYN